MIVRVFGILMVVFLAGAACLACECANVSVGEGFQQADVVFLGQVIRGDDLYGDHLFRVEKSWKGLLENRVVIAAGGFDSGYPFQPGEVYIVYALRSGDQLLASKCGGTAPLLQASEQLQDLRDRPATALLPIFRNGYPPGAYRVTFGSALAPTRHSFWNTALVTGFSVLLFQLIGFLVRGIKRRVACSRHAK